MHIQNILAELKKQRDLIDQAITALQAVVVEPRRRGRPPGVQGSANVITMPTRRSMSPAARKRISDAMKKRWAQYRRNAKAA